MQIFIRTIHGKTMVIDVDPSDTLSTIKEIVYEREGIPCEKQFYICSGKHLRDGFTLEDCGIHKESTLHAIVYSSGG